MQQSYSYWADSQAAKDPLWEAQIKALQVRAKFVSDKDKLTAKNQLNALIRTLKNKDSSSMQKLRIKKAIKYLEQQKKFY